MEKFQTHFVYLFLEKCFYIERLEGKGPIKFKVLQKGRERREKIVMWKLTSPCAFLFMHILPLPAGSSTKKGYAIAEAKEILYILFYYSTLCAYRHQVV